MLNELVEAIKPIDFTTVLLQHVPCYSLTTIGYLLENMCYNIELGRCTFDAMKRERLNLFRIPLKTAKETKGFSSDNRWKVIVNSPNRD